MIHVARLYILIYTKMINARNIQKIFYETMNDFNLLFVEFKIITKINFEYMFDCIGI